jgi:hypothetical protein
MRTPLAWLRARSLEREERRRRWAVALAPDPDDPEGLPPVVRVVDRELLAALRGAGYRCVHRRVGAAPTVPHMPEAATLTYVREEIVDTTAEIRVDGRMAGLFWRDDSGREVRIENCGFRTPEAYAAAFIPCVLWELENSRGIMRPW